MGAQVLILSKLMTENQFLIEKSTFKVVFDDICYFQKLSLQITNNTKNMCFVVFTCFAVFSHSISPKITMNLPKNIILRHKSLKNNI